MRERGGGGGVRRTFRERDVSRYAHRVRDAHDRDEAGVRVLQRHVGEHGVQLRQHRPGVGGGVHHEHGG